MDQDQDQVVWDKILSQSNYDTPESEEEDRDKVVPIHMIRVYHNSDNIGSDYDSSIKDYYEMERCPNMSMNKEIIEERMWLLQTYSDEMLIGYPSSHIHNFYLFQ